MQTITMEEFKKLTSTDLADGPCLSVTVYGQLAFIVVIKPAQGMRDNIIGLCGHLDASRGNPQLYEREPVEEKQPPTLVCARCADNNLPNAECPDCHGSGVVEPEPVSAD